MSADIPYVPPYRPSFPASINPADFIALRTIVMSMVCVMAGEFERDSGQSAQAFINNLAIACAEAISKADITTTDGRDMEGIRSIAIEQINDILGGIRFPRNSDKTN
jgi:hypothetical protein